jgi:hypothetical protein
MRYLIVCLAALLTWSCEDFFLQEITDFDNGYQPELSVFALLQPSDSLVIVDVRRTISATGGDNNDEDFRNVIRGASVTVSDGTTTVALAYRRFPIEGYLARTDTLPAGFIRPGGVYRISAAYEELVAGGTIVIPTDSVARADVSFAVEELQSGGFTEVLLTVEIPNAPGEEDYYVLIAERSSPPGFSRRTRELHDFLRGRTSLGERPVFEPVSLREFNRTSVQLCVTDAATYTFLANRETAFSNAENPFVEPVLIASNVENGVGHLGGLNCQVFVFDR